MHGRKVKTPRWQQAYGADYRYTGNTAIDVVRARQAMAGDRVTQGVVRRVLTRGESLYITIIW